MSIIDTIYLNVEFYRKTFCCGKRINVPDFAITSIGLFKMFQEWLIMHDMPEAGCDVSSKINWIARNMKRIICH